jgi:hypothetical protein
VGEKVLFVMLTHLLDAPKPSLLGIGADVAGADCCAWAGTGVDAVEASTGSAGGSTGVLGGVGVGTGVVTAGCDGVGGAGGTETDGRVTVGRLTSGGGGSWPALVPAQAPRSPRTSSAKRGTDPLRMCS